MLRLVALVRRLVKPDEAQDLLEYAMLAGLIAVVAVSAVGVLGETIHTAFWELIANSI